MKSEEALEQIAYLREITAKTRIIATHGYPYFILWGILLVIGYFSAIRINPNLVWLIVNIIGFSATSMMIIREHKREKATLLIKQIGLISLIIFINSILVFAVLFSFENHTILRAFWPFQIGFIYTVASVHMGRDLTYIGLWLIATSTTSLLMPMQFQNIWLGITCGCGLIFTGIIFRNQVKKAGYKIEK